MTNDIILPALIFLGLILLILQYRNSNKIFQQIKKGFNPYVDKEITTVLPVPIGALTCEHRWEIQAEKTIKTAHEEKLIFVLSCSKCGAIDKTIEKANTFKIEVCRHSWTKQKDVVLESAYEQAANAAEPGSMLNDIQDLPMWAFQKTVVRERICGRCGEISKVVATNIQLETV